MSEFAASQRVYRDLWGSLRLLVGGRDVTAFRGVPVQLGGYQLTEPYGYGPADFSFPQVPPMEKAGTGDLAWLRKGATAELIQVDVDGARVRRVWRGVVARLARSGGGIVVDCLGEASGRMSLRDKQSELFFWNKDVGPLATMALRRCGIRVTSPSGPRTGIKIPERGLDGGSFLDYCDRILAEAQHANGDQWTVKPTTSGAYRIALKDRATIAGTVFYGAAGVEVDLTSDLTEEPNALYGYGRTDAGELWNNARYPGILQGDRPTFPGTLQAGDTGEYVEALQQKLFGMRYLSLFKAFESEVYDADTVAAVKRLQRDVKLPRTGVVNKATWDALYNISKTGWSLNDAYVAPLVADDRLDWWQRTSNGSPVRLNPDYDPSVVQVDRTVDFGVQTPMQARRWSEHEFDRIHNQGTGWQGEITLATDLAAGDVTHAANAPNGTLSRLDLAAGANIRLRNFDGGTLKLHVSAVDVASDQSVRLLVDTHARDAMTVAQILERDRSSRVKPHRAWLANRRQGNGSKSIVEATVDFGWLTTSVRCRGGRWTVVPVIAGQSGSVNRVRVKGTPARDFCVGITAKRTSPKWWRRVVGNPLRSGAWTRDRVRDRIENKRVLLFAYGDKDNPAHGTLLDDGGWDYHTFDQPVLWVAVFPRRTMTLKPQRLLWPVLEPGA
jgi:hypothetical protein